MCTGAYQLEICEPDAEHVYPIDSTLHGRVRQCKTSNHPTVLYSCIADTFSTNVDLAPIFV